MEEKQGNAPLKDGFQGGIMPCCPFNMIYDNEFEMIFPNDNVPLFEMT